jgi:hypothetical protein
MQNCYDDHGTIRCKYITCNVIRSTTNLSACIDCKTGDAGSFTLCFNPSLGPGQAFYMSYLDPGYRTIPSSLP